MQTNQNLGNRLGSYGVDRFYILQQFVIWGFLVCLVLSLALKSAVPLAALLLIGAGLYLLTIFLINRQRPWLILHENGMTMIDGDKRNSWYWHELTHFEGTRTTHRVNGIPTFRTGANQFYTGKAQAFRVGALTAHANRVVNFVLMKMTELRIPNEIAALENGTLLTYGKTNVSAQGITQKGQFYAWSDIRRLSFRYRFGMRIMLEAKDSPKKIPLSNMEGLALYTFLGVVDHYMQTKLFYDLQKDTSDYRRYLRHYAVTTFYSEGLMVGIVVAIILAIVASVVLTNPK